MPSHWEQILKNTLEEIQMKSKEQPWDEWLMTNDPAAYEEYQSQLDEVCWVVDDEWKARVRLMREATNKEEYVKALES